MNFSQLTVVRALTYPRGRQTVSLSSGRPQSDPVEPGITHVVPEPARPSLTSA